ncbi:hypothetical protein C7212DRAFT_366665 [Tuber magnatum]|uniref:Uncharacterized protein n=1 Tax=Tuber magnatum TaxID=42249 RepID=A0A317SD97_9PEZI|nr:hypothetical protein C7212DRAFT_366665 [Tuber magnatum]
MCKCTGALLLLGPSTTVDHEVWAMPTGIRTHDILTLARDTLLSILRFPLSLYPSATVFPGVIQSVQTTFTPPLPEQLPSLPDEQSYQIQLSTPVFHHTASTFPAFVLAQCYYSPCEDFPVCSSTVRALSIYGIPIVFPSAPHPSFINAGIIAITILILIITIAIITLITIRGHPSTHNIGF